MFQFWATIFMAASVVVFFIAWTRSLKVKDRVTAPSVKADWDLLRTLVLVAIIAQLILVIIGLIGLPRTFAYLSALFITLFSVVYFYSVRFMLVALGSHSKGSPDQARELLTLIRSTAESLETAEHSEEVRSAAHKIVEQGRQLSELLVDE